MKPILAVLLASATLACSQAQPPAIPAGASPVEGEGQAQAADACAMTVTQVGPSGPAVWLHVEDLTPRACGGRTVPSWSSPTACVTTAYCAAKAPSAGGCDPGGACAFDAQVSGKPGQHVVHAYSAAGGGHARIVVTLTL